MYSTDNIERYGPDEDGTENKTKTKFPVWAMVVTGLAGLALIVLFVLFLTKGFKTSNMGNMGKQNFGFQFY